ncbi:Serine protein kinase, PrkA-like [Desulfonema limicola]|uniref:Serine protein kinase, PrkA-like n=1 Tax=Desulfonema limicola TaxID=45656 RepID=A0A975B6I5_9BACT|nr:serine protein kinase PrkA [Desulfonema limicola]QTA79735.1 Serine protein kinase, PrkA-like [Desulfonema limicola]
MENIRKAMENLNRSMSEGSQTRLIPFEDFLKILTEKPAYAVRNVFQIFHDMIRYYVGEGVDEYPDDPESIEYASYDCTRLFVEDVDHPFFADRLFANRLITLAEALKRGAQQNKIYIFDGPPGSGKSTFLNNLLKKFESYANIDEGMRFETVWRLDQNMLGSFSSQDANPLLEKLSKLLVNHVPVNESTIKDNDADPNEKNHSFYDNQYPLYSTEDYIDIPCPSHEYPLLIIPKRHRRQLLDDLFQNDEFKWKLFTDKAYQWVFRDKPCTICSSLYQALLNKLKSPEEVFKMVYVRPYDINRRMGEGISVFNPGDRPMRQIVMTNPMLQKRINDILKDSNQVKYLFSRYAKTNNGIYALMDIKSHNVERLIELHNIISEGVHKVEDIEENVNSLFMALMNPEDKKNILGLQSFSDRIEYIQILYVMDLNTEVEIYRNIFGKHIDDSFLPRVLHNFARVIISSRLNTRSEALLGWIGNPDKYSRYCDKNLQLLKMEIYTGNIPKWLSEDDRKNFTAKVRQKIIEESESEGKKGFSGRDSIKIFNDFYSSCAREDKLINMSVLCNYFTKLRPDLSKSIPEGFLESMLHMYNYTILQEVKESLYNYNEERISRDIQNYLFSINFESGAVAKCNYTDEKLEITDEFLWGIENRLLGGGTDEKKRLEFRKDTQKEYTSKTLTQEILVEEKNIIETRLYTDLHDRYVYNLKEKVLDPFLENENFRQAIKDYNKEEFKTHDKRIREDVTFLINNLGTKYDYTERGAKEVCMYVIDQDLAKKFAKP